MMKRNLGDALRSRSRDANHDVTAIADQTGAVKERFSYDPYGNVTVLSSTWTSTSDSYNWLYLFQGGRKDAVTGNYHFDERDDRPTRGRWLQQDPAGYVDGTNRYRALDDS